MKKLNPKKVFIIADGSYREITPAEHEFRKEADTGYREKKFIGLHSMIMEVSEKKYIGFYRNKRRQKYLDEQRRDNGDVSYDALNSDEFNGEEILIAELPMCAIRLSISNCWTNCEKRWTLCRRMKRL